jgi:hypothetical protein
VSFISVRKTALLAAILNTTMAIWGLRSLFQNSSFEYLKMSMLAGPILVLTWLFVLSTIVFYAYLAVNKAPLKIAPQLSKLSLYAAIVFGVITLAGLSGWTESMKQYSSGAQDPGFDWQARVTFAVRVAGEGSNLVFLLLLILLWRAPAPEASDPEVPGSLDIASRFCVMTSGLWLAFSLYQAGHWPLLYLEHRESIARMSEERAWPQLCLVWLTGPVPRLLTAASFFVAPYVVCMTQRMRPRPIASDADAPLASLGPPVSPLDPQSPQK